MDDQPLYKFPSPPSLDSSEWPGSPLGVSNIITRTKGRTAVHDKARTSSISGLITGTASKNGSGGRGLLRLPSRASRCTRSTA
ncbi:MAG: hypothetical protein DMG23_11210 [Acidobacteria bacterium]|nr:MAG: hypothetical protein DMG23_11210 [Acidobacteriota bacterium]